MNSRKSIKLPENAALVTLSQLELQANRYRLKICDILRDYGCNETPHSDSLPWLMTIQNSQDISSADVLQKALIVSYLQSEYMNVEEYLTRIQEAKDEEIEFQKHREKILKGHELTRSRATTNIEEWFDVDDEPPEVPDELPLSRSIIKEHIKELSKYAVKHKIASENHHVIKDIERLQDHLTSLQ